MDKKDKIKNKTYSRKDCCVRGKGYFKKRTTFLTAQKAKKYNPERPVLEHSKVERPCKRYDREYFDLFAKDTCANDISIPGADGIEGSAIVLRPRQPVYGGEGQSDNDCDKGQQSGRYNIKEGNILLEKSRLLTLINDSTKDHQQYGVCNDLQWDFEPWGVVSSAVLTCTSCGYQSARTKFYEEVTSKGPGRRAATSNARLQLLLQDIPIGPTELQLIFAAVGLRVGSLSGMQKMAYKAAQATEELSEADMRKWREVTKQVLHDRGVNNPDQFSAAFDVRYHGMFKSSTHTPGRGAVQATATCVETITQKKKCIAIDHVNNACPFGSRMKGKGKTVVCGHGEGMSHDGCTATQPGGSAIRERDMAQRIGQELLSTIDVTITHLCTDSDATGKEGFASVNDTSGKNLPPLSWYKDLTHVSRNMKTKILNHNFARSTFAFKKNGQRWNSKEFLDCRKALALDVPERVAMTLKNATQYWRGDTEKISRHVDILAGYMVLCYEGDHKSCGSAPLARLTGCTGGSKGRNWFSRSSSLSSQGISELQLTKSDSDFLLSVISIKLSTATIDHFSRRETTSRCESMNRVISKSCPKNRLFSRISKARVCSAIGRQNNSFKDFIHMKFNAMKCRLSSEDMGRKVIDRYQKKRDLTLIGQKKPSYQTRRHALIAEHRQRYFKERLKTTNEGEYHKYQLDVAQQSKASILRAIEEEPVPSTSTASYEGQVKEAMKSAVYRRRVLGQGKDYHIARAKKVLHSRRLKQQAIENMNKTAARIQGPATTRKLRSEHSYGSLNIKWYMYGVHNQQLGGW